MVPIAVITLAAVLLVAALVGGMRRRARNEGSFPTTEGHGLSGSAAAAMEDVAGPLFGVNAHPTSPEALKRRIP